MSGMLNNTHRSVVNPNTTRNPRKPGNTGSSNTSSISINKPTAPTNLQRPLTKNMISGPSEIRKSSTDSTSFDRKRDSETTNRLTSELIRHTLNSGKDLKRYNTANLHSTTGRAQINNLLSMGVSPQAIENALFPTTTRFSSSYKASSPMPVLPPETKEFSDVEMIIKDFTRLLESLLLYVLKCNK